MCCQCHCSVIFTLATENKTLLGGNQILCQLHPKSRQKKKERNVHALNSPDKMKE